MLRVVGCVVRCVVLSCLVLSCVSCHVCCVVLCCCCVVLCCVVLSCHVISCLVLSCDYYLVLSYGCLVLCSDGKGAEVEMVKILIRLVCDCPVCCCLIFVSFCLSFVEVVFVFLLFCLV